MKTLVIDNYDSFTYNLVHYLEEILQEKVDVYRNDKISIADVNQYDNILISPGPGIPEEAGITKEVIKTYGPTKKILGVCLGHQAIGEVYGSKLSNLDKVYHGMGTPIEITVPEDPLFKDLPNRFEG
ncbi:MAG: anthranilate synthase component II, partial [Bacteroidota bacterium]